MFDHGAPFFSASNSDVLRLVHEWESKGLVEEWKENFGSFDCISKKFLDIEQVYDHPMLFLFKHMPGTINCMFADY